MTDQLTLTPAADLPAITLDDVRAAAGRINGSVVRTPTLHSQTLSEMVGAEVWLKFENLQFTAAYKERGALNALLLMDPEARARGVIAASAGNHAQGLAYHGKRLGVPVTIVMPSTTPQVKVSQTASHGATIVLFGEKFDDAYAHARELEVERGLTFVHPFDHPHVAAGQGTVALEMLDVVPDLDTLVVAVGGGGLIAGMAVAARERKPDIEIVGVQTTRFPAMVNAVKGTHHAQGKSTIAEGIAVGTPGVLTREIIASKVDDLLLVDEGDIEQGVLMLLEIEKTLVEGAGAAGLAALIRHPERFKGKRVGLVLSGGNIDPLLLAAIIERGMVRAGRLARVRVSARDVPGSLAQITATVAEAGANVDEVHHQRAFTMLAAQNVDIELVLQTRGRAHLASVLAALKDAGFEAEEQH